MFARRGASFCRGGIDGIVGISETLRRVTLPPFFAARRGVRLSAQVRRSAEFGPGPGL